MLDLFGRKKREREREALQKIRAEIAQHDEKVDAAFNDLLDKYFQGRELETLSDAELDALSKKAWEVRHGASEKNPFSIETDAACELVTLIENHVQSRKEARDIHNDKVEAKAEEIEVFLDAFERVAATENGKARLKRLIVASLDRS